MEVLALEFIQSKFPGTILLLHQCINVDASLIDKEEYWQQLGSFGVTGDLALQPIVSLLEDRL